MYGCMQGACFVAARAILSRRDPSAVRPLLSNARRQGACTYAHVHLRHAQTHTHRRKHTHTRARTHTCTRARKRTPTHRLCMLNVTGHTYVTCCMLSFAVFGWVCRCSMSASFPRSCNDSVYPTPSPSSRLSRLQPRPQRWRLPLHTALCSLLMFTGPSDEVGPSP